MREGRVGSEWANGRREEKKKEKKQRVSVGVCDGIRTGGCSVLFWLSVCLSVSPSTNGRGDTATSSLTDGGQLFGRLRLQLIGSAMRSAGGSSAGDEQIGLCSATLLGSALADRCHPVTDHCAHFRALIDWLRS